MNKFFHERILTPFAAILLALFCISGTATAVLYVYEWNMTRTQVFADSQAFVEQKGLAEQKAVVEPKVVVITNALSDAQLYRAAVLDAMTIEEGEVLPLVSIVPESDMVTWQDGKVLMMSINRWPERYVAGENITLPGELWVFTDKEMVAWYAGHKSGVTDWPRRLKQLIGVPPEGKYTHVTAMWCGLRIFSVQPTTQTSPAQPCPQP